MSSDLLIQQLEQKNKDTKVIYPDIDDERILVAVKELLVEWNAPVVCWKSDELERYRELIDNGLLHFVVPDDEKNEIFAAKKLAAGEVDGFLGGNISETRDIARALIKNLGTLDDCSMASSYFMMMKEDSLLFFADGGFQVDPNPEQLAEIALLTTQNAINYGVEPRVAFLSFSTSGSGGNHPKALKMREATSLAKKLFQENGLWDIPIEGEIQFDAAFVPDIGKRKNPETTLQKPANVFIFPDLDAANIAYKITERLGWYQALGPILQWFAKPANDLSRGCSVEDIKLMHHITKNQ